MSESSLAYGNPVQSSFDRLRKRAFGGGDVATRPGSEDDAWWPMGPLLPGVQQLIDEFVACVDADGELNLFFMLGGAGNGKSYAARSLGDRLGVPLGDSSDLAQRIYQVSHGGVAVELLNDATIAPQSDYGENQGVALAADVKRWLERSTSGRVAAFCCVNRGIVIDELRTLASRASEFEGLPAAVLKWLASPDFDVAASVGALGDSIEDEADEFRKEVRFEMNGRKVRLVALPVDLHSLLEVDDAHGGSRAGILFSAILTQCMPDATDRPAECPLKANIAHWEQSGVHVWESIARHAEVASGRLHSYRDIWGLAALSILGSTPTEDLFGATLIEHIDDRLRVAKEGKTAWARLSAWLELSQFRASQALFRAPRPSGVTARSIYPPSTPVHVGLSLVDPSVWGSPESEQVEAAMNAVALGESPSGLLHAGKRQAAWSDFDEGLEAALLEYVSDQSCAEGVRRKLISWFGAYLVRHEGSRSGKVGNSHVVLAWQQCWNLTEKGPAQPGLELSKALRSLIFPSMDGELQGSIVVPAFAPRMDPIDPRDADGDPQLAVIIDHSRIYLQVRRSGSRVLLESMRVGKAEPLGQLVLDFAFLREALAAKEGVAGYTELTAQVAPRLERCRVSSLEAAGEGADRLVVISGSVRKEVGNGL